MRHRASTLARLFAQHSWMLPLSIGSLALMIAVGLTIAVGFPPAPAVHDEFSYLLSADTFARGRLTNPPHALWEHFETFHIIHQPTYASKYPPGTGLLLAAAQRSTGFPIIGVWIAYAAMAAAMTWVLQAHFRKRWAAWGGILAATWFAGLHVNAGYWAASYWGAHSPHSAALY